MSSNKPINIRPKYRKAKQTQRVDKKRELLCVQEEVSDVTMAVNK